MKIIKRWNSQFPYDKKIRASDFIIDNSEGKDLMSQIKSIYSQLERELRRSSERKS
jgi:dephospho-CoA kinase